MKPALVQLAPDTLCMVPLWADITSCSRIGIAIPSIDWDRELPPSSNVPMVTAVIFDPVAVTVTDSTPKL